MGYLTPLQRRGLALSGVAFSFCAFIIAHSSRFVKSFLKKRMARPAANYNPSKLDGGATSFVPLLYHNLGNLSRGFCHFLDYVVGQATTHQGGLTSS